MAEEEKDKEQEKTPAPNKKKKIFIIAIAGVVLLLIIIITVFVFVLTDSEEENAPAAQGAATPAQTQSVQGAGSGRMIDVKNIGPMYEMKDFTVNLLNEGGRRYLRTKIDIEMNSENLMPELDKKNALVRDTIIQILSSKQIEEIATIDGKERLKDELVKAINRLLIDGQVKNVYFTNFVIQ